MLKCFVFRGGPSRGNMNHGPSPALHTCHNNLVHTGMTSLARGHELLWARGKDTVPSCAFKLRTRKAAPFVIRPQLCSPRPQLLSSELVLQQQQACLLKRFPHCTQLEGKGADKWATRWKPTAPSQLHVHWVHDTPWKHVGGCEAGGRLMPLHHQHRVSDLSSCWAHVRLLHRNNKAG
jgi:hypothetical protein